jgi:hypothetical protein
MDERRLDRIATQIWNVWSKQGALIDPSHWESSRLVIRQITRRAHQIEPNAPLWDLTRRVIAIAQRECRGFLQ